MGSRGACEPGKPWLLTVLVAPALLPMGPVLQSGCLPGPVLQSGCLPEPPQRKRHAVAPHAGQKEADRSHGCIGSRQCAQNDQRGACPARSGCCEGAVMLA